MNGRGAVAHKDADIFGAVRCREIDDRLADGRGGKVVEDDVVYADRYANGSLVFQDLATGRIDVVIIAHFGGLNSAKADGLPVKEVGPSMTYQLSAPALAKEHPAFLVAINQAIGRMTLVLGSVSFIIGRSGPSGCEVVRSVPSGCWCSGMGQAETSALSSDTARDNT